jgi:hypothetical protein
MPILSDKQLKEKTNELNYCRCEKEQANKKKEKTGSFWSNPENQRSILSSPYGFCKSWVKEQGAGKKPEAEKKVEGKLEPGLIRGQSGRGRDE